MEIEGQLSYDVRTYIFWCDFNAPEKFCGFPVIESKSTDRPDTQHVASVDTWWYKHFTHKNMEYLSDFSFKRQSNFVI